MSFAPCPSGFPAGSGGGPGVVVVRIISVKPNTDLEGDDDLVPFYDNHADIYGFVTIDGEKFDLPQIEDTDFPHWEEDGPRKGVFEKTVTSGPVPITIDIWEADAGLTFDDDRVKINPASGKHHLDFEFDLCALTLSGDVTDSVQGPISISGGSGSDAATIVFTVGLKDARPVTNDDLALMDIDLIQVIPRTDRLVAGKGTVVMARIANNHDAAISTNLRITISGGGASTSQTFPINIQAGEVKKEYFFRDNPIVFEQRNNSYEIAVIADVIDPGSSSLPPNDCRLQNDKIRNRITWKVVTTERKFSMLWAKVGTLLDIGNYTPGKHFAEITTLGSAYIRAVYPLANPVSIKSPIDIPPTPITAASDFLLTVLGSFGLPVDTVEPFLFLFELNSVAALLPQKRLMGVLPNKDWFKRFSGWRDVTGLSLGEFAPRAVIFLPRLEGENEIGPQIALPAHELGHTFGLSVDSRLKNDWVCNVDWPIVGHSGCGFVGGFDEYKHEDANLKAGNPANGYWVKIGNEPPEFANLVDKEQCDSHCFMGGSPINAWIGNNWDSRKRWVDPADYNHLIDKLAVTKDPEVIYVSGMIAWNNQIYVGRCFRLSDGVPDHSRQNGMYCFRFVDKNGSTLNEIGLPVAWNHAEFNRIMPVTFFGVTLEFPTSATKLEIWNRGTGTKLAEIDVNRSVPEVRLNQPKQVGQSTVRLRWTARDKEQSKLSYAVMISPDGEQWWPAAHNLAKAEFMLDTKSLKPGEYEAEILALNSIRVGRSNRASFRVEKPKP